MPTTLPGSNNPNTPPLPGQGAVQPTVPQRAVIEALWNKPDVQRSLAQIIVIVSEHPELLEWAKASLSGAIQVQPK